MSKLILIAGLGLLIATGYQTVACTYYPFTRYTCRFGSNPILTPPVITSISPLPLTDRESLRLAQQELDGLPTSLLLQLIAATILSLLGGLLSSGEFKPIALSDNPSSINSKPFNLATAAIHNTRGRAFASLPHIKANMPQVPSTTTS
jgi:hypothetical protein